MNLRRRNNLAAGYRPTARTFHGIMPCKSALRPPPPPSRGSIAPSKALKFRASGKRLTSDRDATNDYIRGTAISTPPPPPSFVTPPCREGRGRRVCPMLALSNYFFRYLYADIPLPLCKRVHAFSPLSPLAPPRPPRRLTCFSAARSSGQPLARVSTSVHAENIRS